MLVCEGSLIKYLKTETSVYKLTNYIKASLLIRTYDGANVTGMGIATKYLLGKLIHTVDNRVSFIYLFIIFIIPFRAYALQGWHKPSYDPYYFR